MKHIKELQGIGKGKKCLLAGNGISAEKYNYSDFQGDIIGMNKTPVKCKYLVYYDNKMKDYYASVKIDNDIMLIGYNHKNINYLCDRCNYYYTYDDIVFGDTGFHVLQFADSIFEYDEIYLIGYDYECNLTRHHFTEETTELKEIFYFLKWSIHVIQRYYQYQWKHRIYNLNERSALKAFPFKQKI